MRSASAKVGAGCPGRNRRAEAQSLNPNPFFSKTCCTLGMANIPSAMTGATFSNSRRDIWENLAGSTLRSRPATKEGESARSLAASFALGASVPSSLATDFLVSGSMMGFWGDSSLI